MKRPVQISECHKISYLLIHFIYSSKWEITAVELMQIFNKADAQLEGLKKKFNCHIESKNILHETINWFINSSPVERDLECIDILKSMNDLSPEKKKTVLSEMVKMTGPNVKESQMAFLNKTSETWDVSLVS